MRSTDSFEKTLMLGKIEGRRRRGRERMRWLDGSLVKVSWLGKLALVFWWISSLWSAMKCPVVSFRMSVGLV